MRAKNDDGLYVELTEAEGKDLQTDRLTAEFIFEAKKANGDYHDSTDSETFIKWVKHLLLPTLRNLALSWQALLFCFRQREIPQGQAHERREKVQVL